MAFALPSKVFSTDTLVAGIEIVKQEVMGDTNTAGQAGVTEAPEMMRAELAYLQAWCIHERIALPRSWQKVLQRDP